MSLKEGKINHTIVLKKHILDKSNQYQFPHCLKCNQSCYPSLDDYNKTFGTSQKVSGRCVIIDGDMMLVTIEHGKLIIKDYSCNITDEDFVVKEIIE